MPKTTPRQISFDRDTDKRVAYLIKRGRGKGRSEVVRIAIAELYDRVKQAETR